eukprot:scaffold56445_cov60-Phaeocystis_antarctica.AAC.4
MGSTCCIPVAGRTQSSSPYLRRPEWRADSARPRAIGSTRQKVRAHGGRPARMWTGRWLAARRPGSP